MMADTRERETMDEAYNGLDQVMCEVRSFRRGTGLTYVVSDETLRIWDDKLTDALNAMREYRQRLRSLAPGEARPEPVGDIRGYELEGWSRHGHSFSVHLDQQAVRDFITEQEMRRYNIFPLYREPSQQNEGWRQKAAELDRYMADAYTAVMELSGFLRSVPHEQEADK